MKFTPKGFAIDPATDIKTWEVESDTAGKTGPLISSRNGGVDIRTMWRIPQDASKFKGYTSVELALNPSSWSIRRTSLQRLSWYKNKWRLCCDQ